MYETENINASNALAVPASSVRMIQLSDFLAVTRRSKNIQGFVQHFPNVYLVKMGELNGNLLSTNSKNGESHSNLVDSATCEFELPSEGIRHRAKSTGTGQHSYELVVTPSRTAEFIIGRAESADLIIRDPSISAHHAEVRIDGRGVATLRDLGSKNGTKINNVRVEAAKSHIIDCGDLLTFGRLSLQFYRPKSLFPLLRLLAS